MKIVTAHRGDKFIAAFSGNLSENSGLEKLHVDDFELVFLNFANLKGINSIGIKSWVDWVHKQREDTNFVFQHLPPVMINTINTVEGVLPFTSVCESFYAPFFNADSDISKHVLYKLGEDYTQNEFVFKPLFQDSGEHHLIFEFDGIAKKYFRFLEKFFFDIKIKL